MANELFCLKWNNYTSNIITELDSLRTDGDLVDVTILCDGRKITAHKVILSACSSYFRTIFRENPCQHPVVILKDINYEDIEAVLCFVYQGTVYISKSRMDSFLKTAESLQIKGLAGASNMMGDNEENRNISSEETTKLVKRSKPLPPLASVSTNVPVVPPPIIARNSPVNTPTTKRRKLVPNVDEDAMPKDVNLNPCRVNSEHTLGLEDSLASARHTRHSTRSAVNDSIDQDEESNTYNNTAYSSTGEVEDDAGEEGDGQMQYTDDNEDNEEDEETTGSRSPSNSTPNQEEQLAKNQRGNSRVVKEESHTEAFTNSNLNIVMETTVPAVEPHVPVANIIKTESTSPNTSSFYNETTLAQCSTVPDRSVTKKSIIPGVNYNQDLTRGQPSFTEEELPAGSHLAQWGNCPHCGQKYSNQSALKYHVRLVHSDLTNRLCCYLCPRAFTHRDSFKKHMWERHKVRI